ncbi:MAG: hypothetical protein WC055_00055 [Melioribacteraceae bacterium]
MENKFTDTKSFHHWFMISALSGIDITEEIKSIPRVITMQINGVEINPEKALSRLEEEFDGLVEKEAKKMVQEMKNDILDPFEEKVRELTEGIEELIENKLK